MVGWLDRGWLLNTLFSKPRKYAVKLNRKHNKNLLVVVHISYIKTYSAQQCGKSSMRKMIIIIFLPFWIMISWYEMTSSRLLAKSESTVFFFFSFLSFIPYNFTLHVQFSMLTYSCIYTRKTLFMLLRSYFYKHDKRYYHSVGVDFMMRIIRVYT